MPSINFGPKIEYISGSNKVGRSSKLVLWLVVSLVLVSAFQIAPQSPPPTFEVNVAPMHPPPSLCVKEVMKFYVGVTGSTTAPDGTIMQSALYHATIKSNSSNPGIASVVPPSTSTGGVGGGREAIFTVKGLKAGRTTITFSYTVQHPVFLSYDTYLDTREIKVRDCLYQIDTVSRWQKSNGFKPRMVATIHENVFKVQEDGTINDGLRVKNVASPTVRIPCGVGMTVTYSRATISGSQDLNTGALNLTLDFEPVSASTKVTCPLVSGGNTGPGQELQVPRFTPRGLSFGGGGGVVTLTHTVVTDTTDTSTIRIIITPITFP